MPGVEPTLHISKSLILIAFLASGALAQSPAVTTYHNNNSRTGLNNAETILNWTNVNSGSFGLLFNYPVDGQVYAQPLYVHGVGGTPSRKNVVFVATENNSVYAFNADTNAGPNGGLLWHLNFNSGPPGTTVTPVSYSDLGCNDLQPNIGITGTPVIDSSSQTLYVVVKTKETSGGSKNFVQRLHALDLATGAEKLGGPAAIQASVPGSCGNVDQSGSKVLFSPLLQNQRAGLALANGKVYIGWAAHCDINPYNGWLMAYDAATLEQTSVLNLSPDGSSPDCRAGIWQSGAAPAVDPNGNLFFTTGNGTFNAANGGQSYGDSFVKVAAGGGAVTDYFTPQDQANLDSADLDLGAGGVLLLPPPSTAQQESLLLSAGKTGTIYLLDRDNLGQYNPGGAVQTLTNAVGKTWGEQPFPMPVYANGAVYFAASYDTVKAFPLKNGTLQPPAAVSGNSFGQFGAGLSASSGTTGSNAILWALDPSAPAVLHAYRATDLTELYNSNQAGTRDNPGTGVKFSTPTVAGGKVFVGTGSSLAVYGLF